MALITLAQAKAQCRITHDLEDDLFDDIYIPAAEDWIKNYLNQDDIPQEYAIKAACMLLVHDFFNNRGATSDKDFKPNPAVENLLFPYRKDMGI